MPGMLTPYRRHTKDCKHRAKGKAWLKCRCPVWIEGTWSGEYVRRSLDTRSLEQAWRVIDEIKGDAEPIAPEVPLPEACALHAADLAARNVAPATRKKYRQMADRLTRFAGEHGVLNVSEASSAFLREFRASWEVSPVTANKMLERLRAFFGWCVSAGIIERNPAASIKRAVEDVAPTMPFTADELARIFRALDNHRAFKEGAARWNAERLRALVLVLRYTGLRIQDAAMLTREQVQGGLIVLRTMKSGTHVALPVPHDVIEALEFIAQPGRTRYFAPDEANGETVAGNWRRSLRRLFAAANVPEGHAHRFRDTVAVELLENGTPIEDVAMILGHADTRITLRHYAPWVKSRQARLEEHLRKIWDRTSIVQSGSGENGSDWKQPPNAMVSRAGLEPVTPTESSQVIVSRDASKGRKGNN